VDLPPVERLDCGRLIDALREAAWLQGRASITADMLAKEVRRGEEVGRG
jgi:hypothetical protein